MGTNYYAHINVCAHCNRPSMVVHIGKSSLGWKFSFHGVRRSEWAETGDFAAESWAEWRKLLRAPDTLIVDEYGQKHSYRKFRALVLAKQKEKLGQHSENESEIASFRRDTWIDSEGFEFASGTFF